MPKKNSKVYKVGNHYVIKENGTVKIVKKKKQVENIKQNIKNKTNSTASRTQETNKLDDGLKSTNEQIAASLECESAAIASIRAKRSKRKNLTLILSFLAMAVAASIIALVLTLCVFNAPSNLTLQGEKLIWNSIDNASYYILVIDGKEYETEEANFDVSSFLPKKYSAKVCAVKNNNQRTQFSKRLSFVIDKQNLIITPNSDILISKTYDGSLNYSGALDKEKNYIFSNDFLKYGNDVDITIIEAKFNSANVENADKLIVSYSSVLKGGDAKNYQIDAGTFYLEAQILPKEIIVSPSSLSKQFADKDNLLEEIKDEETEETLTVKYTRKSGEKIGFYDIVGVDSTNKNYVAYLEENSGEGRFEIIKRIINISGAKSVVAIKEYDGTFDFLIENVSPDLYVIENEISGYEVDITITDAVLNSANVVDVNTLTVYFSGELIDANGVYQTLISSFEVKACIVPKQIYVVPNSFSKEFGDEDDISQTFFDEELNQSFNISFTRTGGEIIGVYDIISATSLSPNYAAEIIEDSGRNKFKIEKRTLSVVATGQKVDKSYDGNVLFDGSILKSKHYELNRELKGYPVDVEILSARFNFANVDEATEIIVEIGDILLDVNEVYCLKTNSVILPAKIDKRRIEITPELFEKQYGDSDDLTAIYFDSYTNTSISFEYTREYGEYVGQYDIIAAKSFDNNYELQVTNAENKFIIIKRKIAVLATGEVIAKTFDNTDDCSINILRDQHYIFSNTVFNETPEIQFTKQFNAQDITSDGVIINISALSVYSDRYEIETKTVILPARIDCKPIYVEPQNYSIQYGDADYMRQTFTDKDLGLSFGILFFRENGESVGEYDIISGLADNKNYSVHVINGENKFKILPRVLGVEKIGNPTFNKIYDGTTECNLPITLGVHYTLTNLNGGDNVTLNILSQEYNSKNVEEATKVLVRYTAILDGEDGGQFVTTGGTMEFDAVISPRPIYITPNEFHKDYLTDFLPSQNIIDEVSGEVIPVTFVSTAGLDNRLTECGAYDITSVKWTDANYKLSIAEGTGEGKFVIDRINLTINASGRNAIYNTFSQGINQPSSQPERELKIIYKLSETEGEDFTSDLPVNAGTYTARVVFEGDRNYLPQYIERTLFIDRAESVIKDVTPTNYVYDGTVKPLIATLNHSEAELIYSRNNYIDAGTYSYIMISVPQTQNYKAASIVVSLNIERCVMLNSDMVYPTAKEITYGQYLYSAYLSGGSSLGEFNWETPDIKPVVADKQFIVKFVPYDTVNYDWSDVDMQRYVSVTVNKFIVTELPFPIATNIIYTNALSTSMLVGTSSLGTFAWQDESLVPSASGYQTVIFTPYDEVNNDFSNVSKTGKVYVTVSFKLYFETNGGSEISYMITSEISSEPFTYREGYVFDGWFLDETLLQKAVFPLKITTDTVLYAGWYSEGLIFLKHDGYYSVKLDATTVESSVFIPSEYRGLPVTTIESEGFKNCTALEIIVIPDSVVSIGHYAFVGCLNLMFVQIMGDIEEINFGIDWIKTGYVYGTDVYFNAPPCPECDGTLDFHQPGCEHYDYY